MLPPDLPPLSSPPVLPAEAAWMSELATTLTQEGAWTPDQIEALLARLPAASASRDAALLGILPALFREDGPAEVARSRMRLAVVLVGQVTPVEEVSAAAWAVLAPLLDEDASTEAIKTAWRTVGLPLAELLTPEDLGHLVVAYVKAPDRIAPFFTFWLGDHLPDRGAAILHALEHGRFEVAASWAQQGPYALNLAPRPPRSAPLPNDEEIQRGVADTVLAHALSRRALPAGLTANLWAACLPHRTLVRPEQAQMFAQEGGTWGWARALEHPHVTSVEVLQALQAVTPHLLATDLKAIPDPAPVLDVLTGGSTYTPEQVQFMTGLVAIVAHQHRVKPEHFFNQADYLAWVTHDRACRAQVLSQLLGVMDLDQVPLMLHSVLSEVLHETPEAFDEVWTQVCSRYVAPLDAQQSLLQQLVEQERTGAKGVEAIQADLLTITPPDQVGQVLIETLAQGYGLSPRLGDDPSHWPLPVVGCRDRWAGRPNATTRLSEFDRYLALALDDDDLPLRLRERLLDACEAVRPHIAEERFRARDRLAHLQGLPAAEGTSRRARA